MARNSGSFRGDIISLTGIGCLLITSMRQRIKAIASQCDREVNVMEINLIASQCDSASMLLQVNVIGNQSD